MGAVHLIKKTVGGAGEGWGKIQTGGKKRQAAHHHQLTPIPRIQLIFFLVASYLFPHFRSAPSGGVCVPERAPGHGCCAAEKTLSAQPKGGVESSPVFRRSGLWHFNTQRDYRDAENPRECRDITSDALPPFFEMYMVAGRAQIRFSQRMGCQPKVGRRDGARTPAGVRVSESPPGCHEFT